MRKTILLGLVFIFLVTSVFGADSCEYGVNCTWYAYGADTADGVNISFSYENESTTEEYAMVSLGLGKYLYITTHNLTGNVLGCARSYNSTGTIDTACESKEIYEQGLKSKMIIASLIMLPVIFGIILLIFGISLDKATHPAMKIFLSLLSIPMFWTSLHFGVIASSKYLGFAELEDQVALFTQVTGWLFFAIMGYFIIYLFYVMIQHAAQNKEEKLKY